MLWVNLILAATIPVTISLSLYYRHKLQKGIGWQFIRFNTVTSSLVIIALLSLNDAFNQQIGIIIAGMLGYVFAKEDPEQKKK